MSFRAIRLDAFIRRFLHARRGAAAVEFALIATPFVALIFGLIEMGLVLLVNTTLQGALDDAARRVRTGEVQTGGLNVSALKATLCDDMTYLGEATCEAAVNIDVRSYASFNDVTGNAARRQNPVNPSSGQFDPAKMCWDPGGAGSVVLVTAYYPWKVFAPLLSQGLINLSGGKRLITGAAVFRNEPYNNLPATTGGCPPPYP